MPESVLVSVVIPCRNHGEYLRAALASVAAQTWASHEAIVVDDGSTDDTSGIAERAGATVLKRRHAGLGAARNCGLRTARGEYVIFLDADDELVPDAMESGVAVLEPRPDVAMVARCCRLIDADGRPLPGHCTGPASGDLYGELLVRNFVWTPGAAVFRRQALVEIGGFPVDVGPASDYAVYLELARQGGVLFDRRDAVLYRQHQSNMSSNPVRMLRATLAVLRRERQQLPGKYRRQYARGLEAWRTFYGDEIIQQLRAAVRNEGLSLRHLDAVWLLITECRSVVATHIRRKSGRVVRGLPQAPLEPGRFTRVPNVDSEPRN